MELWLHRAEEAPGSKWAKVCEFEAKLAAERVRISEELVTSSDAELTRQRAETGSNVAEN